MGSRGGRKLEPRRVARRSGLGDRMRGSEGCAELGVMEPRCRMIQKSLKTSTWKGVQRLWSGLRVFHVQEVREVMRNPEESSEIWKSNEEP